MVISAILVPLLLSAAQPALVPQETIGGEVVERHLAAMGTHLTLKVEADTRAAALQASEAAVRAIEVVEQRLSTWRDDSELAQLNAAPAGVEVTLSPELATDLARARELWRSTDGVFDPGVGALVQAWGLRAGGRQPSAAELDQALAGGGFGSLVLEETTATRLRAGLILEEGGFGKGIALDAARLALRESGARAGSIDLGGQVVRFRSDAPDATTSAEPMPTRYAVAHPRDRARAVAEIAFARGSLATSGNSERGLVVDGVRASHILDPRTGQPAPDFGSVTVWAEDAITADALSTGLFVMGPDAGLVWAEQHAGVEALFLVETDGQLLARATAGWGERLIGVAGGPSFNVDVGYGASAFAGTPEPKPSSSPAQPSGLQDDDLKDRVELLEDQMDAVTDDLERASFGQLFPPLGDSVGGLGPAASKVYNQDQGLSIGGYGEALFQAFEEKSNVFDFVRAILYVGYKFNDDWVLNSEIEIEHADEIFLEFAYIEYLGFEDLAARAGMLLIPMGFLNELHEPTTYLSATRPDTETKIIPSTWRENGAGIVGDAGPLEYRMYLVNGMDSSGFSAAGLRGGRQKGSKAKAEDFAGVVRVDYVDIPGFVGGASFYHGQSDQDELIGGVDPGDNTTSIYELHAELRQDGYWLRGLAAMAEVDDADKLNTALALVGSDSVGEELEGYYLEGGYDVMRWIDSDAVCTVSPYVRWESIDTQADVPSGFMSDPANDETILTYGINVSPIPQLVFKLELQNRDRGSDSVNFGMGYVF